MPKTATNKPKTGTLRIGDQWNAINIIARSQTHPLKAVCELTENAIDAKAKHVRILRRRSKGRLYLDVIDDGEGVPPNKDNEPDFARIATHVCDSMKRHLDAQHRTGVHGEFGIGLLSFWSLGDELRMASAAPDGRVFEMLLTRGKRSYSIRPLRGTLGIGGTRVIVGPLLPSTKKVVTGEKLVRYLSSELRDRIRTSAVRILVTDRVSRREFQVQPREFDGEQVPLPARLPTPFGEVVVELYFRERNGSDQDSGVAVCKDGTRVLKDVSELIQFQHAPWTEGRVEGVMDFASFELAPGTRSGIVPDEKLDAFAAAVRTLESPLMAAIEQREQAESDKASRDILKQVHRAFRNALRELPSNEYVFFDIPEPKHPMECTSPNGNGRARAADGLPVSSTARQSSVDSIVSETDEPILPLEPGPLASVHISPRHARRAPREDCVLTAVARDERGVQITQSVEFQWNTVEGDGTASGKIDKCVVCCEAAGRVLVQVLATQGGWSATDEVAVKFMENVLQDDDDTQKGLPSYRLEPEHGKPWRSRYDATKNEIVINSAHRDFMSSRTTAAKHRRYIGKLYAKEVVLINFPHEPPAEVMERLIQITLRTEDML